MPNETIPITPQEDPTYADHVSSFETRMAKEIDLLLNKQALLSGYDNIDSAIEYADEPSVPKYQREGQAFRRWRSLVWEAFSLVVTTCRNTECPIPTDEALLAGLPVFQIQ